MLWFSNWLTGWLRGRPNGRVPDILLHVAGLWSDSASNGYLPLSALGAIQGPSKRQSYVGANAATRAHEPGAAVVRDRSQLESWILAK